MLKECGWSHPWLVGQGNGVLWLLWRPLSIASQLHHIISSVSQNGTWVTLKHVSMAKRVRVTQLAKLTDASLSHLGPHKQSAARCFSVLNRPPPSYEGHIPLTVTERLGLAIGSGLGSFIDPRRGGVCADSQYCNIRY